MIRVGGMAPDHVVVRARTYRRGRCLAVLSEKGPAMPGRGSGRRRQLIAVIAAVAAAGVVTGLSVPSAMTARAAELTSAAAGTLAGDSAVAGSQAGQLNGVACLSARDCLAVGSDYSTGTPLAETWKGTRWQAVSVKLPSGASGALLDAVACPAAAGTYCVVVGVAFKGSTAEALAERWNGKAWTPARPPAPAGSQLSAVSCLSLRRCVAVGVAGSTGGAGTLLAESWNGSKWTRGKIAAPAHAQGAFLDGVSCATERFCVATGGVFAGRNAAESPLIEGWNGRDWAVMKPAAPKTRIQTGLYAVSCPSPKSCLTVGSGGNVQAGSTGYTEAWNGKTWSLTRPVPWPKGTADPWLYDVSCPAAGHCVAVGLNDWDPASNDTLTGRAAAATWNGKAWKVTTVTVPGKHQASGFAGVTCRPGKTAFCAAVGFAGPQGSGVSSLLSGFWNRMRWKVILPVR
jgi:hypothetical protein